jgi:PAS domain S-box-containing protein
MTLLWLQNRRHAAELGFWLAGFVMQFVAIVLIALRGIVPDFASIVVGNALVIGATLLLYIGLERYVGKTSSQRFNYILLAVFIVVHTYFTYVQPSLRARNLNVTLALFAIFFQAAWLMLHRVDPEMRQVAKPVGVVFGAYCLVSAVRVVADLTAPPGNDLFRGGVFDTLVVLAYQMLYIALTFALILMVNRRLNTKLEHEIRELKLAQQELGFSEAKFSTAFHSSPDAIIMTSLVDGKILEINESFFQITEYTPEETLGKTTIDLNLWGSLSERDRFVELLQRNGRVSNFETSFRKNSGEILTALISGEMIQLSEGKCVLSVVHDITERKRVEEALRFSEDRYHLLFAEMVEGFALHEIICDAQGQPCDYRFLDVNPAFEKLTGLKRADLIGRTLLEVLPETEPRWIHASGQVALSGTTLHFENFSQPLGKWYDVVAFSPQRGQFATIFLDITERRQAETQRNAQMEELRRWQAVTMGRETRVFNLKREINKLLAQAGQPIRYGSAEQASDD